jgi:hypothetical protein
MERPDNTFEIGYREDGVLFVTASTEVPDADAAERYAGKNWRAVAETFLGPTGRMANSKDEEWDECDASAEGARRGWKLINTSTPEIFEGDWFPNPHYRAT